jgi:Flp pilus assembly protein CpaB
MKPKTLILLVVAVTCGLGASYMTSRLLAERQPEDTEKVSILVAKKDLAMGLTIKKVEDFFEEKKFFKGDEPKNAIVESKDLLARVLKRSLRLGDFVTGDDLLSDKDTGLSNIMGQGYRALGIKVNVESIAAGFASLPMSRVDLIWTVRRANDKDSASRVLLENVLVLAADQSTVRTEGSGAMVANTVVVALKPDDCLKVKTAQDHGTISMVLRKFNDYQKSEVTTVTMEELVTNTAGRRDADEGSWVEDTQQPALAKVEIPALPKETQSLDKAEGPKGTLHRLRLINGDKEKMAEYWLNDNGEVIQNDVVRSEIGATPPRPPQVQPQVQPQAQPRAPQPTPAPRDDEDDD